MHPESFQSAHILFSLIPNFTYLFHLMLFSQALALTGLSWDLRDSISCHVMWNCVLCTMTKVTGFWKRCMFCMCNLLRVSSKILKPARGWQNLIGYTLSAQATWCIQVLSRESFFFNYNILKRAILKSWLKFRWIVQPQLQWFLLKAYLIILMYGNSYCLSAWPFLTSMWPIRMSDGLSWGRAFRIAHTYASTPVFPLIILICLGGCHSSHANVELITTPWNGLWMKRRAHLWSKEVGVRTMQKTDQGDFGPQWFIQCLCWWEH